MYIPKNSITLDKVTQQQIRLGIQGYPGTGKTWSALTLPNPLVIDIDRGLGAHVGRTDVAVLPFYDTEFVKSFYQGEPDNIKEALMLWLNREGKNLEPDQTLILDGITGLESAYHTNWRKHPQIAVRSGKVDDYAEWGLKIQYFGELTDILITLRCNVVVIAHEQDAKDKKGDYNGKLRPMLTGQSGDKIAGKFTDWVRQHAANKPTDYNTLDDAKLKLWDMDKVAFKKMCDSFPRNTIYYWQLESDDVFDGKVSSLVNFPRYIPANYESFKRWMRKPISPTNG